MSWTNYFKKGLVCLVVVVLAAVMGIAFGFNKSFDFTGGSVVTVNAQTLEEGKACQMVKEVLAEYDEINVCSFSVGTSFSDKVITVKYQVADGQEWVNEDIKTALFEKFGYSTEPSSYDQKFISMTADIQPAYNFSVISYALMGALIAALVVGVYMWLRMGLATGVSLVAGVMIDLIMAIGLMLIFRIELSANIGYALLAVAVLSMMFNAFVLGRLKDCAFKEENKKFSNATVADLMRKELLQPMTVYVAAFAIVLLITSLVAFGTTGSAVLLVALSLASIFLTSMYVMPSLWGLAFVRKVRTRRTEKAIEIEKEVE